MSNATHGASSEPPSPPADAVQMERAFRISLLIAAVGFVTPLIVGIAVKYYLQLSGQPHLEWSEVPHYLYLLLMPVVVSWFPFVMLAWIAKRRFLRKGLVGRPVYGAFVGGVVGSIVFFWFGWQSLEGLAMLAILLFPVWMYIIGGMLIGSAIGWLANAFRPTQ